jgi:hypothetical protein
MRLMALDCRAAAMVHSLAAADEHELPAEMPECPRPAVFSTHIVRVHEGEEYVIRHRTCQPCDAAFRLDHGYRDSIRLPGPTT